MNKYSGINVNGLKKKQMDTILERNMLTVIIEIL